MFEIHPPQNLGYQFYARTALWCNSGKVLLKPFAHAEGDPGFSPDNVKTLQTHAVRAQPPHRSARPPRRSCTGTRRRVAAGGAGRPCRACRAAPYPQHIMHCELIVHQVPKLQLPRHYANLVRLWRPTANPQKRAFGFSMHIIYGRCRAGQHDSTLSSAKPPYNQDGSTKGHT
jgi:hypothetical protein